MEPELQQYYENYFDLFSSEGWKQLKEEVIGNISNLEKSTLRQGSKDVFLVNQGYVNALEGVIKYDSLVKSAYEDLTNPPSYEGEE